MNELQIKRDLVVGALRKLDMLKLFEEVSENDFVTFRAVQDLHQSRCVILLNIDESVYSNITIFFATLDNVAKKEKALQLINDLNITYKANKYFINDNNEIAMQIPYISTADKFDAELFAEMIFTAYRTIKENDYSKFMRIMWS